MRSPMRLSARGRGVRVVSDPRLRGCFGVSRVIRTIGSRSAKLEGSAGSRAPPAATTSFSSAAWCARRISKVRLDWLTLMMLPQHPALPIAAATIICYPG